MGEAMEMLKQSLEGLAYIHEQRIAHRAICQRTILMNYQGLITWGFDRQRVEPFRSLFDVQYAITDFSQSMRFPGDEPLDAIRSVAGRCMIPDEAPELSRTVPYNPFAADVYALAATIRERLIYSHDHYSRVVMLLEEHLPEVLDLLMSMLSTDPEERPTAADAYEKVCELQAQATPEILALHGQPDENDSVPQPSAQGHGVPNETEDTEVHGAT